MKKQGALLWSLLLWIACVPHQRARSVEVVGRPLPDISAVSAKTGSELHIREIRIRTHAGSGKTDVWSIIIVQSSGRYWWYWQTPYPIELAGGADAANFPGATSGLYIDGDVIAVVHPAPGPGIAIRTSGEPAATLDDAERAVLSEIAADPAQLHGSPSRVILLGEALGGSFGVDESMADVPPPVVERVTRDRTARHWIVALSDFTGARAEVVLSDDFRVIRGRRLP